eukprot:TRINITY_DN10557_c0_g1_i1.p1 TRINITY_DN10557_c0_g1~~TRINITY_DN10557_c0_g1_i1.p1  ORF type:complete len:987 (-),score=258.71 TRINITY_DN10557_c0_g1_i1:69-3005(-)
MSCLFIALVLLFAFTVDVDATSSGLDIYLCDVYSELWGCNPEFWPNDSEEGRKQCLNASTNAMYWTSAPVRSDEFRVFIGDEENRSPPTSYTPDEYITIGVIKENYEMRFRGLYMYAEDVSGARVGEWVIFSEEPDVFHQPMSSCDNAVFHAGAAVKEGAQMFKWRAPAGTGTVSFRVLIKEGDANTGAFFWPNTEGDITLTEGASGSEPAWEMTEAGQSCREYCESKGEYCDTSALTELKDEQDLANIDKYLTCKKPFLSSCSIGGPSLDSLDFCYYQETEENCATESRNYTVPRCDVADSGVKRLCLCTSDSSQDEDPRLEDGAESMMRMSFSIFALLLCLYNPRQSTIVIMTLLICLSLSQSVEGHNWINSISRSTGLASTYKPFLPKTGNKPHAQVGPGQKFQIEWMTGHEGRLTYLTLVSYENIANLSLHKFNLLEDYLSEAAAAGSRNLANDPEYMRYHRKSASATNDLGYEGQVLETDSNYIERPAAFTGRSGTGRTLWSYTEEQRALDARYIYNSEKYPWIISMGKFAHTFGLAGEYDVVEFEIPEGMPFGKYVLHYMWAGYYDLMEIDYIDQQVEYIYGEDDPEIPTTYSRIDHCYFPDISRTNIGYQPELPYRLVVDRDPTVCLERCRLRGNVDCKYVQVLPLHVPSTVKQSYREKNGIYQTLDFDRLNTTLPELLEKYPEEDTYICYDLGARIATATEGEYIISNDPRDPVFYSTCYIQNNKIKFIGYDDVTPSEIYVPWRFGDKCLSCEDHARIKSSNYLVPHWKFADKCVNCDELALNPEEYAAPKIVYNLLRNASFCDGFDSSNATDIFRRSFHSSCTNGERCVKKLDIIASTSVSLSTCAYLVAKDPQCSSIFTRRSSSNPEDYKTDCFCYMNHECCHTCSTIGSTSYDTYEIAENEFTPDPTCETGTKATDGSNACCSGTCGTGQCAPGTGTREAVGTCCSDCIYRSCNEYGPPCMMDAPAE